MIDLLSFLSSILSQEQQQRQFGAQIGQSEADRALRQRLADAERTQQAEQFSKTFGFDTNKFKEELALQKANQLLQSNQMLGSLGQSLKSPDILNLLGKNLGIAGLGYRLNAPNPWASATGSVGASGLPANLAGYSTQYPSSGTFGTTGGDFGILQRQAPPGFFDYYSNKP